jgi:hypothetical protein
VVVGAPFGGVVVAVVPAVDDVDVGAMPAPDGLALEPQPAIAKLMAATVATIHLGMCVIGSIFPRRSRLLKSASCLGQLVSTGGSVVTCRDFEVKGSPEDLY